jgi:hypothetical protein
MGGNQALCDTATILPLVSGLAQSAQKEHQVTTEDIAQALVQYETEMIPRAFDWVEKSGGRTIMVSDSGIPYVRQLNESGR